MKESALFINFFKRNSGLLAIPLFLGLVLSVYFYAQAQTKIQISQAFNMSYNLENINIVLALTDQAVTQTRIQNFQNFYPDSNAIIYKSSPLTVMIETQALTKEIAYELFLKESGYLRQNFSVTELTQPQIITLEPSLLKYLISGLLLGFLVGLITSLVREYFRNY